MVRKLIALLLPLACCLPGAAQAKWLKAESKHYIVYSEDDEQDVRRQAERLEKLNLLQHAITALETDKPSIKVKVFVLRSYGEVQESMPFPTQGVAGYYDASVRGPYSVISRESDSGHGFPAQLVLFHELTHHFMFQYYNVAYPVWYVEGFAEFVGASKINDTNVVVVGEQSAGRYYNFAFSSWTPIREIMLARNYDDMKGELGALYAEGWLLTHYLELGPRKDQLTKYLADINAGKSYEDAANRAFGNLDKLNAEVKAYSRRTHLPAISITFKPISIPPITVEEVPAAQAAMMRDEIRLFAGVPLADVKNFAARVRADQQRAGETPFTLRLRAEADRLAGDRGDYASVVARWNAIAPEDPQAMLHQALLKMDALQEAKSTDTAAWSAARRQIVAASRKAPDDAIILKAYFDSFKMNGIQPSADAHNALFKALDLVPADAEVRYQLAADFEARGDIQDAINIIRLAAFTEKGDLNDKERAKRDKSQEKHRIAGIPDHETPRDMLDRLLKKQKEARGA